MASTINVAELKFSKMSSFQYFRTQYVVRLLFLKNKQTVPISIHSLIEKTKHYHTNLFFRYAEINYKNEIICNL